MRAARVIAVTAGLTAMGAAAGALLGIFTMLALLFSDGISPDRLYITLGAGFGAAIGAVLAPTFAWVLLRRVPLGRAIAGTAAGTVAGVLLAAAIPPLDPIVGGILGFAVAAVGLRLRSPRPAVEGSAFDEPAG